MRLTAGSIARARKNAMRMLSSRPMSWWKAQVPSWNAPMRARASTMARGSQRGMRAACPASPWCGDGSGGGVMPGGDAFRALCPVSSVGATEQVSPTPPTIGEPRAIFDQVSASPEERSSPGTPPATRPWPPSRPPGPRAPFARRAPPSRDRARRFRRIPCRSAPSIRCQKTVNRMTPVSRARGWPSPGPPAENAFRPTV